MSHPIYSELKVQDVVPFGQDQQTAQFFALRMDRPAWENWRPGQFVMVRPQSFGLEMPWARPLGICRVTDQNLVCFFQISGRGTARMATLAPGDKISVWGPLGNSFAVEPDIPTMIIAGGVGIAPFIGYAYMHPKPWNLNMLFGHKALEGCYPVDSLNERIQVDCMREEKPGDLEKFINAIRERMAEHAAHKGLVLACGPMPFLRTVKQFAAEFNVRTQLSLEGRMGCGVGACLGCVVKTTEKWPVPAQKEWPVQVCNHGPIFWSDQVNLD